jgi:hypothetical protein
MLNDVEMIESVIVLLDQLEVKGVQNMRVIFDCISRLDALRKSFAEREENNQDAKT